MSPLPSGAFFTQISITPSSTIWSMPWMIAFSISGCSVILLIRQPVSPSSTVKR